MTMFNPTVGIVEGASYNDPFATKVPSKDDISKDAFLLLLVEQLKNQDPLEPMDGTDFTAQLAQFSSLEQQTSMNDNLMLLQDYSSTLNRLSALDMIGKAVEFDGGGAGTATINGDGQPMSLNFELADNAQDVVIDIYNDAGGRVATLELGYYDLGPQSFNWNGKDADGNAFPEGNYTFEVTARDELGQLVISSVNGGGEVQGVETDPKNGNTVLVLVDGTRVGIDQVVSVKAVS
ncbi:MAG: flagellar hook capping FlgD N-terminal domain-containing protein [Thermodesulfobacteriota bacterium]|nr:flagellar hook capping FlgD N-terminal domain-containing protein [Thermodesulfobacteriota bacterium]